MTARMPKSILPPRRVRALKPFVVVTGSSASVRSGAFFPPCPNLVRHIIGFAMQGFV